MRDDSPSIFPCTHPRCPYSWCAEIPEETAETFRNAGKSMRRFEQEFRAAPGPGVRSYTLNRRAFL